MKWRINWLSFVFILLSLVFVTYSQAFRTQELSKEIIEATQADFNQAPRLLRPEHPMIPTNYLEYDGALYYYVVPRRLKRLAQDGEQFIIKEIRYPSDFVNIEFQSETGAKVRIRIYSESERVQEFFDTIIPGILRDLFDYKEPWFPNSFIGNSKFKVVHLAGANHLPVPEMRFGFATLPEAENSGFSRCGICFVTEHWIPAEGYNEIRKQAVEAARLHQMAFPPVEDDDLQKMIKEMGESILRDFPISTKGYNYEFKILHSEMPWAQAYPTGFVFVSDSLLEMIEDPIELEFILAREISHVEISIQEVLKDPLVGTKHPLASSTYEELYEAKRTLEMEVDFTALVYVAGIYKEDRVLHAAITALRKLQFYGKPIPEREAKIFDTHPTIIERVAFLKDNFFIPEDNPREYCDLIDDEKILFAEVLGSVIRDFRIRLFIRINATDSMNKEGIVRGKGEVIVEDGSRYNLDRTKYPKLVGRDQSRIFLYDIQLTRFDDLEHVVDVLGNISDLDLGNIGGASDWKPCSD